MKPIDCAEAREAIPEVVLGLAGPAVSEAVEAHVEACPPCGEEFALVSVLATSRVEPSAGLVARIERAISFDRQAVQRPWWALTAAAVAALALGIGFSSGDGLEVAAPAYAMEADEAWAWGGGDEGSAELWAGGVLWDELSDDDLARLLDDLDGGGE